MASDQNFNAKIVSFNKLFKLVLNNKNRYYHRVESVCKYKFSIKRYPDLSFCLFHLFFDFILLYLHFIQNG